MPLKSMQGGTPCTRVSDGEYSSIGNLELIRSGQNFGEKHSQPRQICSTVAKLIEGKHCLHLASRRFSCRRRAERRTHIAKSDRPARVKKRAPARRRVPLSSLTERQLMPGNSRCPREAANQCLRVKPGSHLGTLKTARARDGVPSSPTL